jgi:hypothetical protein
MRNTPKHSAWGCFAWGSRYSVLLLLTELLEIAKHLYTDEHAGRITLLCDHDRLVVGVNHLILAASEEAALEMGSTPSIRSVSNEKGVGAAM